MAKQKAGEGSFIDVDLLDPINMANAEAAVKEEKKMSKDKARELLERRRRAYKMVFSPGKREQSDIDIVLADLARFSRAFAPKFDLTDGVHAPILRDIKEGRSEMYYRILDFTSLDGDALYLKYVGSPPTE